MQENDGSFRIFKQAEKFFIYFEPAPSVVVGAAFGFAQFLRNRATGELCPKGKILGAFVVVRQDVENVVVVLVLNDLRGKGVRAKQVVSDESIVVDAMQAWAHDPASGIDGCQRTVRLVVLGS